MGVAFKDAEEMSWQPYSPFDWARSELAEIGWDQRDEEDEINKNEEDVIYENAWKK